LVRALARRVGGPAAPRQVLVRFEFGRQVAMVKARFETLPDELVGLQAGAIREALDDVLRGFAAGLAEQQEETPAA
jgi:hypothetical protein